jgi:MoaA/NifB/PqqE/SkfB family radical SAM enzyme
MINFRAANYEDPDYDNCGSTTIAVLEVNSIRIPLCDECVEDLINHVKKFSETTHCHACKHFKMSDSGWRYGGYCELKNRDKDCMDTCENAEARHGKWIKHEKYDKYCCSECRAERYYKTGRCTACGAKMDLEE